MVTKEERRWGSDKLGVRGQQIQTITYKIDKQRGPTLYSTGDYIQYPIINHNEKEYEKEYIHITELLAVHQKLTQHCKSPILLLKT